ncbi:MAG: Slp family lipoprotein [Syntrophobacterales bacterium]|jgi:outer membrane lipoprotein|nr:Slp family lipoprotein [Syntrophobacterales bacterium]
MHDMRLIKILLTCCGLVILAACASLSPPAFDAEVIKNVDQGITFPLLQQNPEAFKGRTVLLGGQIVSADLTSDGLVNIEVKQKPLDVDQKPVASASSQGVFLIQFPGEDLKEIHLGDLVSVVGTMSGTKILQFGSISYPIILINAQKLNYWREPAALKAKIYYPWEVTPRTIRGF